VQELVIFSPEGGKEINLFLIVAILRYWGKSIYGQVVTALELDYPCRAR